MPKDSGVTIVSTGQFLEQKGIESYGEQGEFGNHVWLTWNDECFDAERPEGVKNFIDLPFFQRRIKRKELHIQKDHDFYLLVAANPEKYKKMIYLP